VSDSAKPPKTVIPGEGVTAAERQLAKLCKHSFLSLWSYPSVFRDQGRTDGKGDGKEICDLLVVFENHIFIFSDKDCAFKDTGRLEVDWARWYKKAVLKSAEQVFGAERWMRKFPTNLFLDRQCSQPLPITLPAPAEAIFHRIVVAHDGARQCRNLFGGSGSLMMRSTLIGDAHLTHPFIIGNIDPVRGFVHVFDDTTLNIVMSTLDTITDFTAYITKKEQFLTGKRTILADGEEELLALYLGHLNQAGEHDFVIKGDYDLVHLAEGSWTHFANSPERRTQVEHDRISYAWDGLIEKFLFHAMTGTQYLSSGQPLSEQEEMYRWMAREPRTIRRIRALSLRDVLERSLRSGSAWDARVLKSTRQGEPYYVILCVRRPQNVSDEEYRQKRIQLLSDYCHVTKLKWPDVRDVIGIATESGNEARRSEDLIYLRAVGWDEAAQAEAKEAQARLGILKRTKMSRGREWEYPADQNGQLRGDNQPSRNSQCFCGSGKRFKSCHGKELLLKNTKRKDVRHPKNRRHP